MSDLDQKFEERRLRGEKVLREMKERHHKSDVRSLLLFGLLMVGVGGSFFLITTPENLVTFYRNVGAILVLLGAGVVYWSFKVHRKKPD